MKGKRDVKPMNAIQKYIFKSEYLAPLKYCVHYFVKREEATKVASEICGKENVTRKLVNNMIWAHSKYHYRFDEYFMYDFPSITPKKRRTYIPFYNQADWIYKINSKENTHFFANKQETFEHFKKYFKRDLIFIPENSDNKYEIFSDFVKEHKKFIIKPSDSSCGNGVQIFDLDSNDIAIDDLYKNIICSYDSDIVIEDLIVQSEEVAKYHPSSVNTIRSITIRLDDRVEVLPAVFRIGQNGSIIDNASAGGIMAAIDPETGILTRALDEYNHKFIVHPNTGVPIVGGQIPDWEDAKSLVQEMALVIPQNRFTGWDIAHTNEGWVLVEANSLGELIFQYTTGEGCKEMMTNLYKEMNVEPFI